MLAYIWNTQGKLPGDIYALPPLEKEFVYQATMLKIKQEERDARGKK